MRAELSSGFLQALVLLLSPAPASPPPHPTPSSLPHFPSLVNTAFTLAFLPLSCHRSPPPAPAAGSATCLSSAFLLLYTPVVEATASETPLPRLSPSPLSSTHDNHILSPVSLPDSANHL